MINAARRWGFMLGGTFVPVPKMPLLLEDETRRPPFSVTLPIGEVREIVEEPEPTGAASVPADVLAALVRLNEHARAFGCGKAAIYTYKTFVACAAATDARPVQIGVKCHHCDGTGQYRDWDGYLRGPCYRCTNGVATLRFIESRIGDLRWHHPYNTGGQQVLDCAWGVVGWKWPREGPSIATLADGTERSMTWGNPGSWEPNMPGARKLPTTDAAELLNVVEAWLQDARPRRSKAMWSWERARGAINSYRLSLDRIDEQECWLCHAPTAGHCVGHHGSSGYLEFSRRTCDACQAVTNSWPKAPHPDTMTPAVRAWLAHPARQAPYNPPRRYDD